MIAIKVMSFPDRKRPCLVLQGDGRCTVLAHFKSEIHADLFCRIIDSYKISREYEEKNFEDCMSELFE